MQNKSGRELQVLGQLSKILLTVALLFIAWVWLLHFPWSWVLNTMIVMEIFAVAFVLLCEYQGSEVNGASGWISFAYLILHAYVAVILGVMRLLLWLWQYVFAYFF